MTTESARSTQDEKTLLSMVEEMSRSNNGADSTKHWADAVLWFDIPPFASRGLAVAREKFDTEFATVRSLDVEILETETFLNGDMGIVCSVQRWKIVMKDGTARPPMLVRTTDCFERRDGQWKVIHEHLSLPTPANWDGKIHEAR